MASRMLLWLGALAVFVAGGMAIALSGGNTAPGEPWRLRPDDAKLVTLGQQVYEARCASCHGVRLEGQANWRQPGADGLQPRHDEHVAVDQERGGSMSSRSSAWVRRIDSR